MKKNLAISLLSILLIVSIGISAFAYNGVLSDRWKLQENNAQYQKYISEVDSWKKCILDKNVYKISDSEYIKLSEVQECNK
jgi:hypothetical protein